MRAPASVLARAGESEGGGAGVGGLAQLSSLDGQRMGWGRAGGVRKHIQGQRAEGEAALLTSKLREWTELLYRSEAWSVPAGH